MSESTVEEQGVQLQRCKVDLSHQKRREEEQQHELAQMQESVDSLRAELKVREQNIKPHSCTLVFWFRWPLCSNITHIFLTNLREQFFFF